MFWYILFPSIFVILGIVLFIIGIIEKDKSLISFSVFATAAFSIIGSVLSYETYKRNHPINTYKVEVVSTWYNPNTNRFPTIQVRYNNQIYSVKVKDPENWKKINIGDTILVKGYNEDYLNYYGKENI